MRGGKKDAKNQGRTGWTTINESEEYVLDPVRNGGDAGRSDAASSKVAFSHASTEVV